ncbi:hypothetical protein ASB7_02080 [Helicobacter ailurogastricus]|nr:hypothetical protein ASB7_02080 [Helicobacter ailurogastricus]
MHLRKAPMGIAWKTWLKTLRGGRMTHMFSCFTPLFEWGYRQNPDQMHRFKVDQKSIYKVKWQKPSLKSQGQV